MSQPTVEEVEIGDWLLIYLVSHPDETFVAQVVRKSNSLWYARHCPSLSSKSYINCLDTTEWFGPDPHSWKEVVVLGREGDSR